MTKVTYPKTEKLSIQAWVIWIVSAAFYLYEYILRVSPGVMTHQLMRDFSVTSTAIGFLGAFYYYSYVPLQVPCGLIVDRFGVRRVVTTSALLCTIGSFFFSTGNSFFQAEIGRFLMGAGSACAYISCMKVASEWFPVGKFAMLSSIAQSMGVLGGTFGGKPFALLINHLGWREAMMVAVFVGLALTFICWLVIRDHPDTSKRDDHNAQYSMMDALKIVGKSKSCWCVGIYGLLMFLPLSTFSELWGVPYLMQVYNIRNDQAASASVMFFIGMAVGCPLATILSDYIKSRLKVMSWSALGTMVPFLIIIYYPGVSFEVTFALLFIAGVIAGGQILYFTAAKEMNPSGIAGTVVGFTNALVMTSALLFQPILGKILDACWSGARLADGTPFYSVQNYQVAFSVLPIGFLFAWIILKFVPETYPTEDK